MTKLVLRLLLPFLLCLGVIAYAFYPLFNRLVGDWFKKDLDSRAESIANTLHESVEENLRFKNRPRVKDILQRATRDGRLSGISFCLPDGSVFARTEVFPLALR